MREDSGDLWSYPAEYRCVTTNGIVGTNGLVMGAGVALQASRRYPHLPKQLGDWVKKYGNRPFVCKSVGIITFPTKHDWKDDADLDLILNSDKLIVEIVDKFGIKSVVSTRPGCGNGHLDWKVVSPHVSKILDDRFVVLIP